MAFRQRTEALLRPDPYPLPSALCPLPLALSVSLAAKPLAPALLLCSAVSALPASVLRGNASPGQAAGTRAVMRVPSPLVDVSSTVPPIAVTVRLTIARPRPWPGDDAPGPR